MKEQTKVLLLGLAVVIIAFMGFSGFLTKYEQSPYYYNHVKPAKTYSLDTTQWRIPKNDTVLYISDKYHVHKVVIIFSDSAY